MLYHLPIAETRNRSEDAEGKTNDVSCDLYDIYVQGKKGHER
jgi:hypothetical protein